jgi:hypothetical protein
VGVYAIFMRAADRDWIGNRYGGCAFILAVFATLVAADGIRSKTVKGWLDR